jgi:hypothetical protein
MQPVSAFIQLKPMLMNLQANQNADRSLLRPNRGNPRSKANGLASRKRRDSMVLILQLDCQQ